MSGRWEKNEYVWECPGCGCMRCSRQAPSTDEARCLKCRAAASVACTQELVDQLQCERDEWMARARKAERENDEQCDLIHELREQLEKARAA